MNHICCICLLNELTDSASLSSCGRLFHKVAPLYPKVLFRNSVLGFAKVWTSDHFNVVQRGNLAFNLKFTTAPTAVVSLVCYAEFENTIHTDSERNVIYDYGG